MTNKQTPTAEQQAELIAALEANLDAARQALNNVAAIAAYSTHDYNGDWARVRSITRDALEGVTQ